MYIMAASINTFDSEEDQNWFKAWQATRWTREGIQGVIATGAERLHKDILEAVCSSNSIPTGTTCDHCSTASLGVLPCPTRGVCKKQRGKCQFHTVPVSACPNKICDALREEIKSQHRYRNPSWKNTRAERWCREPFELIKCFLPEDGYLDIENLESTDFNGIVSILINCKWFTSIVKDDMSTDDNVCTKARVVARDLRHNSRFQLDTAQLQDLMTAFLNLLQALAPDPGAQEANDKVTKLQVGGVTISAIDINSLIKDIRESIKGTVEDAIDQSSETRKIKLDEATKRAEEMINRLVDMKRDTQKVTAGAKKEMTAHKEIVLKDTQQVTAGAKEEMTAHKEILLKDTQQVTAGAKEEMTAHKEILLKDAQQVTAGAKEEMTAHKEILLKDTQQVTAGAKEEMTAHKEILLKDTQKVTAGAKKEMTAHKEIVLKDTQQVTAGAKEEMTAHKEILLKDTQQVTAGAKEEMTAHKEILLKDTQQVTAGAKEEMTAHKEILLKDTQQVTAGAKEEMTAHKEILLKDTQQVTAGAKEEMTAHKEILLKDTQQVTAGAKEEMTAHKEILLKDIECSIHTKETKTCNQKKHEFRQDLITHYRNKKCFAQVSPLNLKHKAPLDNMYVPPKLLYMQKEEGTSCRQSSNGPPVKTYTDLFFKDGRKLQNIYIQGEAGSGKSTFCSHLASVWCRAHSAYNESEPTSSHDCFSDIGVLKRFDFLFLVILRIANETDTDIRALIQNQIAAQLSNENRYTELFVGNILDREVCLVVIDGLDEWPLSTCIPKGIFRLNCTFVTTTRPWKMTEVQLANTDVDAEILIDGVVDSELLISNVLECLKQRQTKPKQTTKERSCENFMEEIRERGLGHLLDVPIVTTQLVCVWFVTGTLGQSRCEVYARTFEMFLKRSQADKERKITATSDSTKLPPCFSEKLTPVCNTNRDFIEHLSKLAFNTLLSEDRNTSIVFDKDIVCEHLSDSECRLALDTGILSEFEVESVIEERSSFNFLHKTFQEFLCAMYIAKHEGDNANSFWEKLTCTYGNVLDMKVIFTFTCGMNKNVGEYLSAHISNAFLLNLLGLPDLFHYHDMMLASFFFFANKNDVRHYQDMMLAGFSECIDNGHAEPNLTFLHSEISAFKRLTAREITYRDQLLDVNAGRLLTLVVDKEDVERVQKEVNRNPGLRNVFMIGDDFQELLYSRSPCCSMDLTKCTSIEILYLHSTNVELPTNLGSTLVECALFSIQTELIQSTILSALGAGAPRLRKLIIRGYHCSCQLLQLLPKLKSLQWLCVSGTVIGDQDLILPRSILNVILNQVNMSERAFKKFVDMLTHMSQEVECFIKFDATEKQVNERCLKYVEENDMCYIQGRTAEESIWFTCPKKKV